ncbi:MAG: hypothetical protein WCY70_05860 [Methanoculleus sp.]|jgi:hypothetical protein
MLLNINDTVPEYGRSVSAATASATGVMSLLPILIVKHYNE